MNASFYLPTRVIAGRGALAKNAAALALGKHALIVTGRKSARLCGALDDVTAALDVLGIGYTLFDKIAENPPLLTCYEGGRLAAEVGADLVIGIGGGSPMDAAKAIAAFAANPEIEPLALYDAEKRVNRSLPIVAVPTTAGTGSEVNPYAVVTLPDGLRKKTFTCDDSWPRVACSFAEPAFICCEELAVFKSNERIIFFVCIHIGNESVAFYVEAISICKITELLGGGVKGIRLKSTEERSKRFTVRIYERAGRHCCIIVCHKRRIIAICALVKYQLIQVCVNV